MERQKGNTSQSHNVVEFSSWWSEADGSGDWGLEEAENASVFNTYLLAYLLGP